MLNKPPDGYVDYPNKPLPVVVEFLGAVSSGLIESSSCIFITSTLVGSFCYTGVVSVFVGEEVKSVEVPNPAAG